MEIKKIAILHRDNRYAKDFSDAVTAYCKLISVVVVFSSEGKDLIDADYVLTDNIALALEYQERGIHLYEDECDVQDDLFSIARFQSIRSIVSQLIEHCASDAHVNPRSLQEAGDTSFIGITSGAGGTGTSSLAVCMGRILSRLYKKNVLYLSFAKYKPLHYAFCFNDAGCSAGRLLYHLNSQVENGSSSLKEYLSEDVYSLKCISGGTEVNSLLNIEEDDLFRFFDHIACSGNFETVILDVPCSFRHYKTVMRMCERQVVNFGFKTYCYIPSEFAKNDLEEICSFDAKTVTDRLFEFRPLQDDESFILKENGFDIDIHGQFGAEVRALVDSMEI